MIFVHKGMRLPATLNTYNSDNNLLTEFKKYIYIQSPDEEAIYGTGTHYHEPNQFITKVGFCIKTLYKNNYNKPTDSLLGELHCKIRQTGGAFYMTVDPFDIFIRL